MRKKILTAAFENCINLKFSNYSKELVITLLYEKAAYEFYIICALFCIKLHAIFPFIEIIKQKREKEYV